MRNIRIPQVFTLIRFYVDPLFLSENNLILHGKKQKSSENQLIFRTFLLFALMSCTPSGIRTLDPLIKSQLLYQLS